MEREEIYRHGGLGRLARGRPARLPDGAEQSAPAQAASASAKSIAVLPFLNESGNPNDEYFSDGLSEELIAALAQIDELKVIGRSSSFRFKGRNEESKTIGEKLGVNTLLEGTVRKQGDHVRIVAELINAADGAEVWTRTFQRELKDIFAVQAEIASAVAEALELKLLGREKQTAETPRRKTSRRTMSTSRATSTSSAATWKIIARRSASSTKRSGSIPITPSPTRNVPRPGPGSLIKAASTKKKTGRRAARDAEKAVAVAPLPGRSAFRARLGALFRRVEI